MTLASVLQAIENEIGTHVKPGLSAVLRLPTGAAGKGAEQKNNTGIGACRYLRVGAPLQGGMLDPARGTSNDSD